MANVSAPNGFTPFWGAMGSPPNFTLIKRKIAYNDSTAIGTGDPVKSLNTGYVSQWTASTAVSQLAGIFVGCKYKSTSLGRTIWNNYWPGTDVASTDTVEAYLIPLNLGVPVTFSVQSSGTAIGFADIGQNVDVSLGTVNTANGRSGASVDQSTLGVTATLPFRIVGLLSDWAPPGTNGTDDTSTYNRVIVAANVAGAGSTGI